MVTDLLSINGCSQYLTIDLPFQDAQSNIVIATVDDTDCTSDNGSIDIDIGISDVDRLFGRNQTDFALHLISGSSPITTFGVPISVSNGANHLDSIVVGGYSSDFSTNFDGWLPSRIAFIGNVDGVIDDLAVSKDDVLETKATNSFGAHYIERGSIFIPGNDYNVTFDVYIPSSPVTNPNTDGFRLWIGGIVSNYPPGLDNLGVPFTTGEWRTISVNATPIISNLRIDHSTGGVLGFAGDVDPTKDLLYIKNMVVTEVSNPMGVSHPLFQNLPPGNYSVITEQVFGDGCFSPITGITIDSWTRIW